MNYQEKYDELDNIVRTLDMLVDEITDRDYIDMLNDIKYQAQSELDEVSEKLEEERDKEERKQEREYWEVVI